MIETRLSSPRVSYYLLGKKIYFILNSNARSGNVSEIIRKLSKSFPLYSFNVILSSASQMATEITRDVLGEDVLFIVLGGDGTLNNAIQYLTGTKATLGVVPKGTANDLASYFGLDHNLQKCLAVIADGNTVEIDTVKVNGSHVLTIGSVGFPSIVADAVNRFKANNPVYKFIHRHILKSQIYNIFALALALFTPRHLCHSASLELDGNKVFEGQFVAIFFGKIEFLGRSFQACPGARHDDDSFKVSVLKYTGWWQAVRDIWAISRARSESVKNLQVFEANDVRLRTQCFMSFLGDGEILDHDDEYHAKRCAKSLRLLVPRSFQ